MKKIIFEELPTFILRFMLISFFYLLTYGIGVMNEYVYLIMYLSISYLIYAYILIYPIVSVLIFYLEKHTKLEHSFKVSFTLLILYYVIVILYLFSIGFIDSFGNPTRRDKSLLLVFLSFISLIAYFVMAKKKFFLSYVPFYKTNSPEELTTTGDSHET